MFFLKIFTLQACVFFLSFSALFAGEIGVTDKEIRIGQSCALTGPAAALGTELTNGSQAYFNLVNSQGGVHGRKIKLITYDDGYNPVNSVENTRKLLEEDKVFALFGYVGTPTSQAVDFYLNAMKVKIPFLTPFTGAKFLRSPVKPWVFNIRASYDDEIKGLVNQFVDDLSYNRIAVFYQNDTYGETGLRSTISALGKRGQRLVSRGSYQRNTIEVGNAMEEIAKGKPQAIIMIGAYRACAEFIRHYRQLFGSPAFANISFVGSASLVENLEEMGEGVYISQVVPSPTDETYKVVVQCKKILGKVPTYGELEGCINAIFFTEVLKGVGKQVTRDGLQKYINEKKVFDIFGLQLAFDFEDHQGMDQVFFTKIENGKLQIVSKFK